jgi:hypothetical protein
MSNETLLIPIGSKWRHKNGDIYFVCGLANLDATSEKYPVTVIYTNIKTKSLYTRLASGWHKSFTLIPNEEIETNSDGGDYV